MYLKVYEEACQRQEYQEHIAGDITQFRYPHLKAYEKLFEFSPNIQTFIYKGDDSEIKNIAQEDITIYEFLSDKARRIHISDMLGCQYQENDKEAAMKDLWETYENRKAIFEASSVMTVTLGEFVIKEGYEFIGELYQNLMSEEIKILTVPQKTFPFGSVLKGTNIIITDQNKTNLGQDLIHMLFHLNEGIPGMDHDNDYVKEIWAPVPQLYAFQLKNGRMGRRVRLRQSPHLIHFQDYIYLRAYLGQCLKLDTSDTYHPVYRMMEPALQFIFHALKDKAVYDQVRILTNAILCDKTDELVNEFDACFGKGSFSHIYGTYSIYDKYELAQKYMSKSEVEDIMFQKESYIYNSLDSAFVEEFWRKRINENSIVLPDSLI